MDRDSGNVLWFVLLAAILLGALTAMMVKSSGTSDDTGSYEKSSIDISSILRYANGMRTSIERLLSQGCSESQISFENSEVAGYANANAPADDSCDVFEPEGAGMHWKAVPDSVNDGSDWVIVPSNTVSNVGCDTADSSCTDLLLMLPGIDVTTCTRINNRLGVTNPSDAPPQDTDNAVDTTTKFTGSFTYAQTISDTGGYLSYKEAACLATAADTYAFYYVLIKR